MSGRKKTYCIECLNETCDVTWRRLESAGTFINEDMANKWAEHANSRSMCTKYRVARVESINMERKPCEKPCCADVPTLFRDDGTIQLPANGDLDNWLELNHPDVYRAIAWVQSEASTSDAHWSYQCAAGQIIADLVAWMRRAEAAMQQRKPISYERLLNQLPFVLDRQTRTNAHVVS